VAAAESSACGRGNAVFRFNGTCLGGDDGDEGDGYGELRPDEAE